MDAFCLFIAHSDGWQHVPHFSICMVARFFGQKIATGFYHDYSGFVIFVIGVLLMFKTCRWVIKIDTWAKHSFPRLISSFCLTPEKPAFEQLNWKSFTPTVLIFSMALFVFISNRMVESPAYDDSRFLVEVLPKQIGAFIGDQPWFCQNEQCHESSEELILIEKKCQQGNGFKCPICGGKMEKESLGELQDLPKDTEILKRIYRSSDSLTYSVSVVLAGRSRGSIHRAELCLPAQGFVMLSAKKKN